MTSRTSNQTDCSSVLRIQPRQPFTERLRLGVPVLQETLLLMELETQELCADLRTLSELVLSDLGATLQVLRLTGREYGDSAGRPTRVEDCIADLGVQACVEAMSAQLIPREERSRVIAELWSHSREIARHSRQIAQQGADMDPNQAYLVGLCHSIGSLPSVLGWSGYRSRSSDSMLIGLELAREWSLPECVMDYFSEGQRRGGPSRWHEMVEAAHQCAGYSSGKRSFREDLRGQLLQAV